MATAIPAVDLFNPLIQHMLDSFEESFLPEFGLEGHEKQIKREFAENAKRPHICASMERVLSGAWGMGTTQQEVADALGVDRSRLSDALRKGEMSIDTYLALRFSSGRSESLAPDQPVMEAMNRSGFIAVARYLAGLVVDRPTLNPDELDELNHELLCEMFTHYAMWVRARLVGDVRVAAQVVEEVVTDGKRNVIPSWYQDDEVQQINATIASLRANSAAALRYLSLLQDNWEDVYIAAIQATEDILWS